GLRLSEEKWKNLSNELGWSPYRIITIQNENIEAILPLLRKLKKEIIIRSLKEREGLLNYLSELGVQRSLNPAVVDIGYSGSVQKYLNKLLGRKVHGYYFITSERSQLVSQLYEVIVKGCFYQNLKKSSNIPILYKYSFFVEKLISFNEPQIQYYNSENGLLRGSYRELNVEEYESIDIQRKIHHGSLDFVREAKRLWKLLDDDFRPSTKITCLLMEEFLENLSMDERQLLQNLVIDDYYCGRGKNE
ncbi:MAG: hypothetical protein ACPL3B_05610, partial [Fervidobacterium sp.]